jgi:hypothetical protein
MYVPFSSEGNAFWIAIGTAALVGVSVAVGVLTVPLAGAMVFAVGALAAVLADATLRDPNRRLVLREAAHAPHPNGPMPGARHVLIVANDTLDGSELSDEITLQAGAAELDILAPPRCSRWHYLMSDYDREAAEARARLDASLAWATAHGFDAHGEVGDPNPASAIADELRDFGADAVIVVKHPSDRATWLESRELKRIRSELDVPVKEVTNEKLAVL